MSFTPNSKKYINFYNITINLNCDGILDIGFLSKFSLVKTQNSRVLKTKTQIK